jgi:AraC-like DNA-binding protein
MIDSRIKRIKKYAQNHIKERITLKRASEITNIRSNYFSALFKKEVGISFSQYLRIVRVRKAKKLLRKTTFSNKEISYDLGFRHVSSFCRELKEVTGKTPSAYRKRFSLIRLFQHVTGGIVRIVYPIKRIANAIHSPPFSAAAELCMLTPSIWNFILVN